MGNIRFTNNASALLAAGILSGDTSLTLSSGQGSQFPSLTAGQYSKITCEDVLGNLEIMHMTARAGDVLTVSRAQEGTLALAFPSGSRVELRATAAVYSEFLQRTDDTLGIKSGGTYKDGEVVNSPIRGETGVTTNQFVVPPGGGAPTIGGAVVYTAANLTQAAINALAFPVGTIVLWYGALGNIPAGFQVCDGTNGTPDLRDRFVVGAGTTYAMGATGGAVSVTSGAGGAHLPVVQATSLTIDEMPAHSHHLGYRASNASTDNGDQKDFIRSYGDSSAYAFTIVTETVGSGNPHSHNADAVPDHTHSVATLPPYRAIYYLMRV